MNWSQVVSLIVPREEGDLLLDPFLSWLFILGGLLCGVSHTVDGKMHVWKGLQMFLCKLDRFSVVVVIFSPSFLLNRIGQKGGGEGGRGQVSAPLHPGSQAASREEALHGGLLLDSGCEQLSHSHTTSQFTTQLEPLGRICS